MLHLCVELRKCALNLGGNQGSGFDVYQWAAVHSRTVMRSLAALIGAG
jgi:hypothetical protein